MCQYWDNHLIYWTVYWLFYWHVPIVTHSYAIVTTHFLAVQFNLPGRTYSIFLSNGVSVLAVAKHNITICLVVHKLFRFSLWAPKILLSLPSIQLATMTAIRTVPLASKLPWLKGWWDSCLSLIARYPLMRTKKDGDSLECCRLVCLSACARLSVCLPTKDSRLHAVTITKWIRLSTRLMGLCELNYSTLHFLSIHRMKLSSRFWSTWTSCLCLTQHRPARECTCSNYASKMQTSAVWLSAFPPLSL